MRDAAGMSPVGAAELIRPTYDGFFHAIWALRRSFRPGRARAAAADDRLQCREYEHRRLSRRRRQLRGADWPKRATATVAFAGNGADYISRRTGAIVKTDNPLDVAVQGDAWLAIKTPAGVVYTRDGRMTIQESGELTTLNGYSVLDAGGAPILLDPSAGLPEISRDGMISQKGNQVGALGLYRDRRQRQADPLRQFRRHPEQAGNRRSSISPPMASPRASSKARTSIRSWK